jgi:hypothetical protein
MIKNWFFSEMVGLSEFQTFELKNYREVSVKQNQTLRKKF